MRLTENFVVPRLVLVIVSLIMLSYAAWLHTMGHDPGAETVLVIYGVLIVASLIFERWQYKPKVDLRQRGWEPTEEIYIDPATGERMQVWFNAETGQRDYRLAQ